MINPLAVASDGYLNCGSPLGIVARGYLDNCGYTPVIPITPEKPVGSSRGPTKSGQAKQARAFDINVKRIIEEDAEIMIIIKSFLKCQ